MKQWFAFMAVGSAFATLGEFIFCVLVRDSLSDYAFTLVAYPCLLTPAYAVSRLMDRLAHNPVVGDLVYNLGMGAAGLLIEWFAIGNSPWANPSASQIGMFAYWATLFSMPRFFLARRSELAAWRRVTAVSFTAFAAVSLLIGWLLPKDWRLFILVWLVIVGYLATEVGIGVAIGITARSRRPSPAVHR